jgi:UDP-N-acetylmuramoyl-L-alanyl-D-glutamate--2,6-diaminopimelate ligase
MHMTMPGPWIIQKLFAEMLESGCTHVVIEVTSEGLKQHRHTGITFKTAVFTNLSPEHLASHGNNFQTYKEMKGVLFKTASKIKGSLSIVNTDTEHGAYYASFPAQKIITYGLIGGSVQATHIRETPDGLLFDVDKELYQLNILGTFNVANALPAIILGKEFGMLQSKIRQGLAAISLIPGRMERIIAGQPYTVIVDYAHEQLSINALLDDANSWRKEGSRIITVVGAEGGGRDPAKREHMGRAAGAKSDYVIVTTTDPYDDDPLMLCEAVAGFAEIAGKKRDETLFVIVDRREGLKKALSIAREDDIVLITGMGAQETMMVAGEALPWNERLIVRELVQESLTK